MSILSNAARSAACDAVTALVNGGAAAGKLKLRASAVVIAEFTLNDPAYAAAVNGVATANGFPKTVAAAASGVPDNYQITDSDDNVVISGTVGEGTGDISLDNTDINSGQNVTVNSLTHTQPAS